jgi:hypothetical protein
VFAQEGSPTGGQPIDTYISYPFPVAGAAPIAHVIDVGGTPPAGCSGGSSADPKADPGHLCIYISTKNNVSTVPTQPYRTFGIPGNGRFGIDFQFNADLLNVNSWAGGSWAMTAP